MKIIINHEKVGEVFRHRLIKKRDNYLKCHHKVFLFILFNHQKWIDIYNNE